jgi:hypothetical protein
MYSQVMCVLEKVAMKVDIFTQALYDEAKQKGWTVISMQEDLKRVFDFE